MDSGKGHFDFAENEKELQKLMEAIRAEKNPNHGGVFKVGEEITIRGR